MQQRSARRARHRSMRLGRAINASVEQLEGRLLLSTYTVTSAADGGPGTLRDAIANSTADTIRFSVTGTIALSSQLEITRRLTINGPGAGVLSVSGQNAVRVFQVDGGAVVAIDGITITGGHAANGAAGAAGAAQSAGGMGGVGRNGGGILNLGTLTLENDAITGNSAGSGGAGGMGGAGNSGGFKADAGGAGGAGGSGGGIYSTGSLTLTADAINANHGGAGGAGADGIAERGLAGTGGGFFSSNSLTCVLGNTIIAQNSAAEGVADVAANVQSEGTNLIGVRDGSIGWIASDLTGTAINPLDPKLQRLGNFGGPTLTMPPMAGSTVIDSGSNALITSPPFTGPPFVDQRGFPRIASGPSGGTPLVDIGAVEIQSVPLVVGTTSQTTAPPGQLTFRTAIAIANSSAGDHRITFDIPTSDPGYDPATGTFTITLGSTLELSNTSGRTIIQGPGAAVLIISGNSATRVFQVDANVMAEIDGITITAGHAPDGPDGSAGTMPSGAGRAAVPGGDGGGVLNLGLLTLTDDIISNSAAGVGGAGGQGGQGGPGGSFGPPPNPPPAQGGPGGVGGSGGDGGNGGGIYSSGQLILIRDTISGNRAGDGGAGGIGGAGGAPAGGLYPSLAGPGGLGGNGGTGGGGAGVYCTGSLVVSNSTIAANFAGAGGAGGAGGPGGAFGPYIDYIGGNGGNGGAGGDGAGIHGGGSMNISGDSIRQNLAGAGGDGGAAGVGTFPGLQPARHGLAAAGGSGGGLYLAGTSGTGIAQTSVSENVSGAPGTVMADAASGAPSGDGAGIFSIVPLTLNGDTIDGNSIPPATGTGTTGGNGGGIYEMQDLTSSHNSILNNAAGAGAPSGGPGGAGGGVFCAGQLESTNDLIKGNVAGAGGLRSTGGNGGGVYCGGAILLMGSQVSANAAGAGGMSGGTGGSGGGIFYAAGTQGRLLADTVSGNLAGAGAAGEPSTGGTGSANAGSGGAGGNGGGISGTAPLWLADDTIAENAAGSGGVGGARQGSGLGGNGGTGGSGGGIYSTSSVTLTNCTISGNVAGAGGLGAFGGTGRGVNGAGGSGGGICDTSTASGAAALGNTIVAVNLAAGTGPDVSAAALLSHGFNLIGVSLGSSGWIASDQTGTTATPLDPKLAPLGNYGGPTPTMALLLGSLALDHGSNSLASNAGLTTDQRGFARVFNGTVDIGAYESQPPAVAGDVNHDGVVNFSDLLILAQHYGSAEPLFESGDLNGDGSVGFSDLLILAQNYGQGATASPATVSPRKTAVRASLAAGTFSAQTSSRKTRAV